MSKTESIMRSKRKRGDLCARRGSAGTSAEDPADEVVDELQAAIDTCARAAEAELRRHDDGGEKLQLLPDLVEVLKVMGPTG